MKTELANGVVTDGTHIMVPHRLFRGLRGDQHFDCVFEGFVLRIDELDADDIAHYGVKPAAPSAEA
jgi:hypothetical protein